MKKASYVAVALGVSLAIAVSAQALGIPARWKSAKDGASNTETLTFHKSVKPVGSNKDIAQVERAFEHLVPDALIFGSYECWGAGSEPQKASEPSRVELRTKQLAKLWAPELVSEKEKFFEDFLSTCSPDTAPVKPYFKSRVEIDEWNEVRVVDDEAWIYATGHLVAYSDEDSMPNNPGQFQVQLRRKSSDSPWLLVRIAEHELQAGE